MAKSRRTRCIIKNPLVIETTAEHLKACMNSKKQLSGVAFFDEFKILIDENLDDTEKWLTMFHECLHLFFPDLSERQVIDLENIMGNLLWSEARKLSKNKCNKKH